jgi:hypothetical protein
MDTEHKYARQRPQIRPMVKRLPPDAIQRELDFQDKKNALRQLRERHRLDEDGGNLRPRTLAVDCPDGTRAIVRVPVGRYLRPAKMPAKWTSLYGAVDFVCRMAFASSGGDSRLFPGEIIERICRPSTDQSDPLFHTEVTRVVATLGGPIMSPETAGKAISQIRYALKNFSTSEVIMPATFEVEVDDVVHRLAKARDELSRLTRGEQRLSSSKLYWGVATEVLAAVRHQAAFYVPKGYGEGIPKSVDIDQLHGAVLGFLDSVISADEEPPDPDAIVPAIDTFLNVLKAYDGTIRCAIDLVLTGSKLVVALSGGGSIWGLFSQLNVVVMGKPVMASDKFISEMRRLCDCGERLRDQEATEQGDVARIHNWINHNYPIEKRLPRPTRFCSYTRTNEATYLLHMLAGSRRAGQPESVDAEAQWDRVEALIKKLKSTDGGFALNSLTDFLHRAMLADRNGKEAQGKLVAWLRPAGNLSHKQRDFAAELLMQIRDSEDSPELVALGTRYLFTAYPSFREIAA